ncbi:MAG: proline--tRNA ligase [Alphaproteobacteria bacterium]
MRASAYFFPTLKEIPSEAQIASHRLMLRAGLICQVTAGVYAWLPLGLKVLRKIEQIVREEQNRAGCLEVLMPTIQPAELWRKSGRYDDYGKEMLRFKDRHERDMLYGPTAEEVITDIFQQHVKSYRDLPKRLYNIQWKFRDEIRPRFGVMRGREFLMKDTYSFDLTPEAAKASYVAMFKAYLQTFHRLGLRAIPVRADTGPIGGDLSHEFHILAETGESTLYYDAQFEELQAPFSLEQIETLYAATQEKHVPENCPVQPSNLRQGRGIEVGHIFYFGTKYAEPLGAFVTTAEGKTTPVEMGSYGIGVSRLVGAIIEASHDEKGIIWPKAVAPFDGALINIKPQDPTCRNVCEELYHHFSEKGAELFYDDREAVSAGAKFADMDLIGLPYQMIVGPKGLAQGFVEVKNRKTGDTLQLTMEALKQNRLPEE